MKTRDEFTVLVVDDDERIRRQLAEHLNREGLIVVGARGPEEALDAFMLRGVRVVLLDTAIGGGRGLDLLEEIKRRFPDVEVMVMSDQNEAATAVEAMRRGAHDYLVHPFEIDLLVPHIERMAERYRLRGEVRELRNRLSQSDRYRHIVGAGEKMREIYSLLDKVIPTDSSVLLLGETGTGKELVARTIHENSRRAPRPFVAINCAAIPENLLESQLFGHEKGAFTGAVARQEGYLRRADQGTLFLDEIGEMPMGLQAKLLRVIQERVFTPLGSTREQKTDIRLICASNRNLKECVKEGRFREDLYYRINVMEIHLPPLRERREDIPLLVDHLLRHVTPDKTLHPSALEVLVTYSWPGNVRELQNVLERVAAFSSSTVIRAEDLPAEIRNESGITIEFPTDYTPSFKHLKAEYMRLFDVAFINRAMSRSRGNVTIAAEWMGIGRTALQALLRKYKIRSKDFKRAEGKYST